MKDSELGVGVVVNPKYYSGFTKVISEEADQSQLLIHLKVIDGKVEYYTGFGWKKSEQFSDFNDWKKYLVHVSKSINNPLQIQIVN